MGCVVCCVCFLRENLDCSLFFAEQAPRSNNTGGGEFAPNLSLGKCCTQTSEFYTKEELRGAR